MQVLITRPRAEAERLAEELVDHGIEGIVAPMLEISRTNAAVPDASGFQALLATSARGLHAFADASQSRQIPVYGVGGASTRAAIELGFRDVVNADGDVAALIDKVKAMLDPTDGPLLHAAGLHTAGEPMAALEAAGFTVTRAVLYEAVQAQALPHAGEAALRAGSLDMALFFSPRSAEAFVQLVLAADLAAQCETIDALCYSTAVARAAGELPWRRVRTAARPNQTALLALLDAKKGPQEDAADEEPAAATPSRRAGHLPPPQVASPAPPEADPALPSSPRPRPPSGQSPQPPRRSGGRLGLTVVALLALAFAAGVALWPVVLPRVAPELVPLAGGADIGALAQRLDALEAREPAASAAEAVARELSAATATVAELEERIGALESATDTAAEDRARLAGVAADIAALRQRVATAETVRAATANSLAGLDERIAALEQAPVSSAAPIAERRGEASEARLAQLEAALGELRESSAASVGLRDETARIAQGLAAAEADLRRAITEAAAAQQAMLATASDRLAALEAAAEVDSRRAAELLAVGQLREAMNRGDPYRQALAAVTFTAGEAAPAEALAALARHADAGIATTPMLSARFPDVVNGIVEAGRADDGSWVDQTVGRLRGIVTVRRIGEVNGASAEAVVARAERRLAAGDLAATVAELESLEAAMADAAAPWLAEAAARLEAERALDALIAHVLVNIDEGS